MCEECGCMDNYKEDKDNIIPINRSVTEINDYLAEKIRNSLKKKEILCVNIQGSPGSGKTTFIEGITNYVNPEHMGVIQGDLESDVDKQRLLKKNIDTIQINTHSGCHLNSDMILDAIIDMNLESKKYIFIENVGNLVCPAGVEIGQHMNLVISSTTEGSDKPKKYPLIFRGAKLVLISKYDIATSVEFDINEYVKDIKNINASLKVLRISSKKEESFEDVAHFLKHQRDHLLGHKHHH